MDTCVNVWNLNFFHRNNGGWAIFVVFFTIDKFLQTKYAPAFAEALWLETDTFLFLVVTELAMELFTNAAQEFIERNRFGSEILRAS